MSAKFDALAAKVGSRRLAGWITQHNPTVHARAAAAPSSARPAIFPIDGEIIRYLTFTGRYDIPRIIENLGFTSRTGA